MDCNEDVESLFSLSDIGSDDFVGDCHAWKKPRLEEHEGEVAADADPSNDVLVAPTTIATVIDQCYSADIPPARSLDFTACRWLTSPGQAVQPEPIHKLSDHDITSIMKV